MKPTYSRKPIRFIFAGDQAELSKFRGQAKAKMNLTETQAKFQNLPQITQTYTLNTGIGCVCVINNTERVIYIGYKKPSKADIEKYGECDCGKTFTTGLIVEKYKVPGYDFPSGYLYDVKICQAKNKKTVVTDCSVYDFSEFEIGDQVLVGLTARERFALVPFDPIEFSYENLPWGLDTLIQKPVSSFYGQVFRSLYANNMVTEPGLFYYNLTNGEYLKANYIGARDSEFIYTELTMCDIRTLQAPGAIYDEKLEVSDTDVPGKFFEYPYVSDVVKLFSKHTRSVSSMITETSMLNIAGLDRTPNPDRVVRVPSNNFVVYPL